MSAAVSPFPIPPVVKTVTVRCAPETAFRVFTAEIGRWWPLTSHSLAKAANCLLEGRLGGRLYEIDAAGAETVWGHVLAWDPPRAVAFSWLVGLDETEAQRIDVRFSAVAQGTEVRLVHAGWENIKTDAAARREKYDGGWVEVFERRFKEYADRAA
jgi:uncharacterized protein YndB with AHSA1/START domain